MSSSNSDEIINLVDSPTDSKNDTTPSSSQKQGSLKKTSTTKVEDLNPSKKPIAKGSSTKRPSQSVTTKAASASDVPKVRQPKKISVPVSSSPLDVVSQVVDTSPASDRVTVLNLMKQVAPSYLMTGTLTPRLEKGLLDRVPIVGSETELHSLLLPSPDAVDFVVGVPFGSLCSMIAGLSTRPQGDRLRDLALLFKHLVYSLHPQLPPVFLLRFSPTFLFLNDQIVSVHTGLGAESLRRTLSSLQNCISSVNWDIVLQRLASGGLDDSNGFLGADELEKVVLPALHDIFPMFDVFLKRAGYQNPWLRPPPKVADPTLSDLDDGLSSGGLGTLSIPLSSYVQSSVSSSLKNINELESLPTASFSDLLYVWDFFHRFGSAFGLGIIRTDVAAGVESREFALTHRLKSSGVPLPDLLTSISASSAVPNGAAASPLDILFEAFAEVDEDSSSNSSANSEGFYTKFDEFLSSSLGEFAAPKFGEFSQRGKVRTAQLVPNERAGWDRQRRALERQKMMDSLADQSIEGSKEDLGDRSSPSVISVSDSLASTVSEGASSIGENVTNPFLMTFRSIIRIGENSEVPSFINVPNFPSNLTESTRRSSSVFKSQRKAIDTEKIDDLTQEVEEDFPLTDPSALTFPDFVGLFLGRSPQSQRFQQRAFVALLRLLVIEKGLVASIDPEEPAYEEFLGAELPTRRQRKPLQTVCEAYAARMGVRENELEPLPALLEAGTYLEFFRRLVFFGPAGATFRARSRPAALDALARSHARPLHLLAPADRVLLLHCATDLVARSELFGALNKRARSRAETAANRLIAATSAIERELDVERTNLLQTAISRRAAADNFITLANEARFKNETSMVDDQRVVKARIQLENALDKLEQSILSLFPHFSPPNLQKGNVGNSEGLHPRLNSLPPPQKVPLDIYLNRSLGKAFASLDSLCELVEKEERDYLSVFSSLRESKSSSLDEIGADSSYASSKRAPEPLLFRCSRACKLARFHLQSRSLAMEKQRRLGRLTREFNRASERLSTRGTLLGMDRHSRRYWLLGDSSLVFVEEQIWLSRHDSTFSRELLSFADDTFIISVSEDKQPDFEGFPPLGISSQEYHDSAGSIVHELEENGSKKMRQLRRDVLTSRRFPTSEAINRIVDIPSQERTTLMEYPSVRSSALRLSLHYAPELQHSRWHVLPSFESVQRLRDALEPHGTHEHGLLTSLSSNWHAIKRAYTEKPLVTLGDASRCFLRGDVSSLTSSVKSTLVTHFKSLLVPAARIHSVIATGTEVTDTEDETTDGEEVDKKSQKSDPKIEHFKAGLEVLRAGTALFVDSVEDAVDVPLGKKGAPKSSERPHLLLHDPVSPFLLDLAVSKALSVFCTPSVSSMSKQIVAFSSEARPKSSKPLVIDLSSEGDSVTSIHSASTISSGAIGSKEISVLSSWGEALPFISVLQQLYTLVLDLAEPYSAPIGLSGKDSRGERVQASPARPFVTKDQRKMLEETLQAVALAYLRGLAELSSPTHTATYREDLGALEERAARSVLEVLLRLEAILHAADRSLAASRALQLAKLAANLSTDTAGSTRANRSLGGRGSGSGSRTTSNRKSSLSSSDFNDAGAAESKKKSTPSQVTSNKKGKRGKGAPLQEDLVGEQELDEQESVDLDAGNDNSDEIATAKSKKSENWTNPASGWSDGEDNDCDDRLKVEMGGLLYMPLPCVDSSSTVFTNAFTSSAPADCSSSSSGYKKYGYLLPSDRPRLSDSPPCLQLDHSSALTVSHITDPFLGRNLLLLGDFDVTRPVFMPSEVDEEPAPARDALGLWDFRASRRHWRLYVRYARSLSAAALAAAELRRLCYLRGLCTYHSSLRSPLSAANRLVQLYSNSKEIDHSAVREKLKRPSSEVEDLAEKLPVTQEFPEDLSSTDSEPEESSRPLPEKLTGSGRASKSIFASGRGSSRYKKSPEEVRAASSASRAQRAAAFSARPSTPMKRPLSSSTKKTSSKKTKREEIVDDEDEESDEVIELTDDDEDESDHDDICFVCQKIDDEDQHRDLLMCDACPQVVHLECTNLDIVPEGEFFCSDCVENPCPTCGKVVVSSSSVVCGSDSKNKKSGCDKAYHLACVGLKAPPSSDWYCPNCA